MRSKKSSASFSHQEKAVNLVQKPETIVGAIVLGLIFVMGANAWSKPLTEIANTRAVEVIQPQSTESAASTTPESQPAPAATIQPQPLAAIEVLADTASSKVVIAQANDTFWDIAQRTCGTGVEGYRIEQENGYQFRHVQPGDKIEVTCK